MPPKVSIIILNWNQPEFTVNCVKSVLKQTYKDFEILLVDNGSEDDSLEILRKEFENSCRIRILETGRNLGYAGGNNFGVRNSWGGYVVILNNDTIVDTEWLKWLVDGIESDEKIGAVSSWEIREGVIEDIDLRRFGITNTLLGYQIKYEYEKFLEKTDLIDLLPIDGCSFIYKKRIVDLPFDSEYFIYAEDIYLAWLLQLMGYKNRVARRSIVHHFHNITKKKGGREMNNYFVYLGERNRILNLFLFYELKNLLRVLPLAFLGTIVINSSEPRKIPYRLKSYLWLLCNPREVMTKRNYIQDKRKIPDDEIIGKMSCKLMDEDKVKQIGFRWILKSINKIFYLYCKIVRLNTIESN